MHRHGYKGRKFGRERDQRQALLKGLADSLIVHESIETTLPKAKELLSYTEKLITRAKKGDLHSRRLIIAKLQTLHSAHKLVDEIAPKLSKRSSGHLKISKTVTRRGDNAQMARVSFVDDLKAVSAPVPEPKPAEPKKKVKKPTPAKKASVKKPAAKKPATKKTEIKK